MQQKADSVPNVGSRAREFRAVGREITRAIDEHVEDYHEEPAAESRSIRLPSWIVTEEDLAAHEAEITRRLEAVEAMVGVSARYQHILKHELHNVAIEYMATRDDTLLYQFAEDKGLTVPELRALVEEYAKS